MGSIQSARLPERQSEHEKGHSMKMTLVSVATAVATLAGVSALPPIAPGPHGSMHHSSEATDEASKAYMEAMEKMDQEMGAMEMTNDPGVDFVRMMIPHHQSAIDMAKAYLESGEDDPELIQLSNEIIEAQEKEIAFLKSWLEMHEE